MISVFSVAALNINHLKSVSYPPREKLRFPIELLTIKTVNNWLNLRELIGRPIITSSSGLSNTKITTNLNEILFDTGNETEYCCLSIAFLDDFMRRACLLSNQFDIYTTPSMAGETRRTLITQDSFSFCFANNITFDSKLGFLEHVNIKWLNTLNIGITSIRQFLSILIPESDSQLYTYFEKI
jgi:hypothetical protein